VFVVGVTTLYGDAFSPKWQTTKVRIKYKGLKTNLGLPVTKVKRIKLPSVSPSPAASAA